VMERTTGQVVNLERAHSPSKIPPLDKHLVAER
jgi:hypothetical protein